jgi:hypothetical protein
MISDGQQDFHIPAGVKIIGISTSRGWFYERKSWWGEAVNYYIRIVDPGDSIRWSQEGAIVNSQLTRFGSVRKGCQSKLNVYLFRKKDLSE